jgi:hypothetical protein
MRKNQSAFALDDYIDKYIQDAGHADKKTARHLKEIIPKTTHLEEKTFNEIIEELKKEMDEGENFKNVFRKISEKYILKGNIVKAELPHILTRIILDDTGFIEKVTEELGIPSSREDIKEIVDLKEQDTIAGLFKNIELTIRKVVFATFDEDEMEADPFINCGIKDIVNMLALDTSSFIEDQPLTAVSIRYKNKDDILKRYPILTDAGWHDKFYPPDKNDAYGRTKPQDKSLKGMPEIVHENLKLARMLEDIRFLEE